MSTLVETVFQTVQRESMLTDTETVVVGFSGGADSVSLLHALFTNREELGLSQVVAVHVDHRLRGEESQRDRCFAQSFCEAREIPFYVFSYDVATMAADEHKNVEEMGRELRYRSFAEVASHYPRSRIATAHTADDNAETLLLHLCRGCGLRGLTGIPPMRDAIIRPLLGCSRTDVEQYCQEHDLPFMTDSTNSDTRYSRNRIRHEVLPAFRKINPSVQQAMGRLMRQSRDMEQWLSHLTAECWNSIATDHPDQYRRAPLLKEDAFVQKYLLEQMLRRTGLPIDDYHITCMHQCLLNGGNTALPKGYIFTVSRNKCLFLVSKTAGDEPIAAQPLAIGETQVFGGDLYRSLVISRKEYEQKLNNCPMVFKNACDYDMITDVPMIRGRHDGDSYHPAGRSCGKTLKKLFNETAVSPEERHRIPVIVDGGGIVLVLGFGCDERVRITDTTTRVLLLEKTEE